VNAFYLAVMPPGKPFDGLAWCDTTEIASPARVIQRSWRKAQTNDFLMVNVIDTSSRPTPPGAGIVIALDENDDQVFCKAS
jgi:hypothetical protein